MSNLTEESPIYSDDPLEESRMLAIRDSSDRIVQMARSRVVRGRQRVPFDDTELLWIYEQMHFGVIPLLQPQEYDVMIRSLASELDSARMQIERLKRGQQ